MEIKNPAIKKFLKLFSVNKKKKVKVKDELLVVSAASFIVIAFCLLLFSSQGGQRKKTSELPPKTDGQEVVLKSYTPIPVLLDSNLSPPIVSAQAVLAIDVDSMVPLFEKNPDMTLLPASTTKIMTALVSLDYFQDSDPITVNGLKVDGQRMGLINGEEILAGDLIKSLLVYSANDAAETLAKNYPGGEEAFVAEMNKKASELHLYNTHFENPVGFDSSRHFSTARDLVRVSLTALKNPKFAQIVRIEKLAVESLDSSVKHNLVNTNKLLGKVEGVLGVKTGWTQNARENLVTYVERDGKRILIAVMGSQGRFTETEEIISWIFDNYQWKEVVYSNKF